jgi:uncharacterized protein (DUF4415 family)
LSAAASSVTGQALPGLRASLAKAKAGSFAQIHTPEDIVNGGRGRPVGSKQARTKEAVKIRLDADVLAALRASLALRGKLPRDP